MRKWLGGSVLGVSSITLNPIEVNCSIKNSFVTIVSRTTYARWWQLSIWEL
jgi:hypothetical protein